MSKQLNKFRKNQIEVQVTKLGNSSTSHAFLDSAVLDSYMCYQLTTFKLS